MSQSEEKELKEAWEINAELMAGLETGAAKNKQLRELNAELLAHIRDALDALRRDEPSEAILDILAAIAKAEALK